MRIARLAFAVLSLLAVWCGGLFASGFENTGLGTTARGMGGAFRAVADDWSAAYYNPAGYAYILDNQLGTSLGLINFRDEITPAYVATDYYGNEYGWGIANGQTVYNFHRILNKPEAGFAARLPLWGETVFGLSIYQPFDQSTRWRMWALDAGELTAYNDDAINNSKIPGHHYLIDLDVVAFQLTAAKEFMDEKMSIGIGLQLLRGDLWFSDLTFRANPRGDVNPLVDDRPRDRIPEFSDNQGRGLGFGLRAGWLWKVSAKLNIAATAYLPSAITITGNTHYTVIMPKSLTLQGEVDPNSADYLFVSGEIVNMTSEFETEIKLPASIAMGLSFQATEKLLVAFDAEYTMWSQYKGLAFSYSDFAMIPEFEQDWFTSNLSNPADWDNAGKVSLGLRYTLDPHLTLLAGGCADQSPQRNNADFSPQFMDLGTKKSYNLGGILHLNQWDLGVTTSYTDYPVVDYSGLRDFDEDGLWDNFPGAYGAETFETVLSVGYRF
jgi:long-chain fatty acid transport protein